MGMLRDPGHFFFFFFGGYRSTGHGPGCLVHAEVEDPWTKSQETGEGGARTPEKPAAPDRR